MQIQLFPFHFAFRAASYLKSITQQYNSKFSIENNLLQDQTFAAKIRLPIFLFHISLFFKGGTLFDHFLSFFCCWLVA